MMEIVALGEVMSRALLYMMELLGLIGMIGIMSYIAWTKMLLGTARQQIDSSMARLDATLGALSLGMARGSAAADMVGNTQEAR